MQPFHRASFIQLLLVLFAKTVDLIAITFVQASAFLYHEHEGLREGDGTPLVLEFLESSLVHF